MICQLIDVLVMVFTPTGEIPNPQAEQNIIFVLQSTDEKIKESCGFAAVLWFSC